MKSLRPWHEEEIDKAYSEFPRGHLHPLRRVNEEDLGQHCTSSSWMNLEQQLQGHFQTCSSLSNVGFSNDSGYFCDVIKEEISQTQNCLKFDLFMTKNPARKHIYGVGNDVLQ